MTKYQKQGGAGFTPHQFKNCKTIFKKGLKLTKTGAGFTLIELLVVIAILGILAAVLLVGIDPIEQMNRANDASAKAAAKQVYDAAERAIVVTGSIVPASGEKGQQGLINIGELKGVVKSPYNDGEPVYYQGVAWLGSGDFQLGVNLHSKASLKDASCGPGSSYVHYYFRYSSNTKPIYWCISN